MRDYLTISNLSKAMALGGCVTLMSLPRLVQGGEPRWLYVSTAIFCLVLLAGAATAWGRCGGMLGLFPRGRRRLIGLSTGLAAGLLIVPLYTMWLDPWLSEALRHAGDADRLQLEFPDAPWKKVAIVLWAAGFQVLFFNAAAMSFLCRLTNNVPVALILAIVFRLFVSHLQFEDVPIDGTLAFALTHALVCAIGCILFARTGLMPVALFAAVLASRHFFQG
jgi:hypothetical protein